MAIEIAPHQLTAAQVPAHTHGIGSHKHTIGAHTHGIDHRHTMAHAHDPSTHTHPVAAHVHDLASHVHPLGGTPVTGTLGAGGPDNYLRVTAPGTADSGPARSQGGPFLATAGVQGAPASGSGSGSIALGTGTLTGPAQPATSASSGGATGPSDTPTTEASGGPPQVTLPHTLVKAPDNRPAFLDVLYIIRVK